MHPIDKEAHLLATLTSVLDESRLYDRKVVELMRRDVSTCRSTDTLETAARIMWEHACGCVPVVDEHERPISMLTDRDVCMAAYIEGRSLATIPVSSAMSARLFLATEDEPLRDAERRMRCNGVRRLPVVNAEKRLVGLLTLSDIAYASRHEGKAGRDGLSAAAVAQTAAGTSHARR